MSDWFIADKDGLRQVHERLVNRRGFGLIGGELYQNSSDADATVCKMTIDKVPGKPRVMITVEDDGHGFHNLTHAWTMFAPSEKKSDPTKAGRFNLGEKVVLSFAHQAIIETTTGTVVFNETGRHEHPRKKRASGTVLTAELACNSERYMQLLAYMRTIIVRDGLKLIVNDEEMPHRTPIHVFKCPLQTEIGENLDKSVRITEVQVYEASGDETAMLYELGIPVVETGDRWHYSVQQKVPLNSERDNVTPAFLRSVRVAVFNEMHSRISDEDTTATWVEEASSDPKCSDAAAETMRVKKYGEKSVAADPSNPEANNEAAAHGYTVIPSRGLTTGQRDNLKRAGTLMTSSTAFPTAGKGVYSNDPNAEPVTVIPYEKWSHGMKRIHDYVNGLGHKLMGISVNVLFVHADKFGGGKRWSACYGRGHVKQGEFHFNIFVLGYKWFDNGVTEAVDQLIIHEFGHQYESNHLSEEYYDALCMLGARLKAEVLKDPEWFKKFVG